MSGEQAPSDADAVDDDGIIAIAGKGSVSSILTNSAHVNLTLTKATSVTSVNATSGHDNLYDHGAAVSGEKAGATARASEGDVSSIHTNFPRYESNLEKGLDTQ